MMAGLLSPSAFAGDLVGEFAFCGGLISPQGNFASYSDEGANFMLRVNTHVNEAKAFSGLLTIGASIFSNEENSLIIDAGGFALPAKENIDQYSFSLHIGLQVGSESRNSVFRPRAALAPGLYFFNTETSIRPLDYDEDLIEVNEGQLRFGWKGNLGVDFFFSTKWGISFDFNYDQVFDMDRFVEIDEFGHSEKISRSSRFHTFLIGVVIPLESTDEG
jgi:hypothetical protein